MTAAETEVIEAAREWGHKLIGGEPEPGRRLWLALVDLKKERGEPVTGADFHELCRPVAVLRCTCIGSKLAALPGYHEPQCPMGQPR